MSDGRYNASGYWSNQGSGHVSQYPTTIDEEELEDDQEAYADTTDQHSYDESAQDYQQYQEDDSQQQQVYPQQAYWTDEPETYQAQGYTAADQQQYYQTQTQQYYDDGQDEVTYAPTNASMDVNFSEHGQNPSPQDDSPPSPLPAIGEGDDDQPAEDRTESFVAQRQDSYDRRDEFRTAPDTASIRHVVNTRQRILDADARARARRAARQRGGGGSGSGGSSRGGGSGSGGGSGGGSSSGGGRGSGSGGKSSGKGGSSRSGGRS